MLKRIIVCMVALSIAITLFAGCTGSPTTVPTTKGSPTPIPTTKGGPTPVSTTKDSPATTPVPTTTKAPLKELTYTNLTTLQAVVDNPDKDYLNKAMKEAFNISFKNEFIPNSGLAEALRLRFAGGQEPDVMLRLFIEHMAKELGLAGYLVAFDDYLDKLPNYKKLWTADDWKIYKDLASANDGKLYGLFCKSSAIIGEGWIYRKGTLEKIGVTKMPETTDELYHVMKKFKEAYPDSIPFTNRNGIHWLLYGFEDAFRVENSFYIDPDTNKLTYGPTTQKWRDLMIYLHKLYKEGLIDKEFGTMTVQQWTEKMAKGVSCVMYEYYGYAKKANEEWLAKVDPKAGWEYSQNYIKAYPEKNQMVTRYNSYWTNGVLIAKKNSQEKIDRLIEALNWMASEEGQIKTQFGVEGETFYYKDGLPVHLTHIKTPANPAGTESYVTLNLLYFLNAHPQYWISQGGIDSLKMSKVVEKYDYIKPYVLNYSEQDRKTKADYGTVISDIRTEFTMKFIMGQLDPSKDADWTSFLDKLEKGGLPILDKIERETYAKKYGS